MAKTETYSELLRVSNNIHFLQAKQRLLTAAMRMPMTPEALMVTQMRSHNTHLAIRSARLYEQQLFARLRTQKSHSK